MPRGWNRRTFLGGFAPLAAVGSPFLAEGQPSQPNRIEQWNAAEFSFRGPANGNPFLDVWFRARFRREHRSVTVDGFYDGDATYRVRLMPDETGEWTFETQSNAPELNGKTGKFQCEPPSPGNHGPVVVRNTSHFSYADGTEFSPFGTTCYAWMHQPEELEDQTIETLRHSPFNKMRMCVFPKWYEYNRGEPLFYPFPRGASGENDYSRFNPLFFQHLEKRVRNLLELKIEADLILFHPYDHWGYASMPGEVNDRYLRYMVARVAAYRNVWWSMANEWDFVKSKSLADWDRFFRIVQESDPYQHLRSIHNGRILYDHAKPWITHASIQSDEFEKTHGWLEDYRKPVVFDECKYEGNIPQRWGNISAREMVRRFWLGMAAGAYVGHGETYADAHEILWWSKGGILRGGSAERIAFLRRIIEAGPAAGLTPLVNPYYPGAGKAGDYYLYYFDYHQPVEFALDLPGASGFDADLIDPWEMKITALPGPVQGKTKVKLPGAPYLALRLQKRA
jgi:hypothetical protein